MRPPAPTIGADVHYVTGPLFNEQCAAAKVTETDPANATRVGLVVFLPGEVHHVPLPLGSFHQFGTGAALDTDRTCGHDHLPGTWHWPRRV